MSHARRRGVIFASRIFPRKSVLSNGMTQGKSDLVGWGTNAEPARTSIAIRPLISAPTQRQDKTVLFRHAFANELQTAIHAATPKGRGQALRENC
ncbi:MAG: hypothetical protein HLUCCO06_13005 [Halomonas sp. HL-93]|nr:MAG: hypothetical protein HLUCCO06_13005 [Halomonas sp. HL-93]